MRRDYIKFVLATYMQSGRFDQQVGAGWILDDSYQNISRATISAAFDQFGAVVNPARYDDEFFDIFDALRENNGVVYDGDEYTDQWFRFDTPKKNQVLAQIIQQNPAHKRLETFGAQAPEALQRVFSKIFAQDTALDVSVDFSSDAAEVVEAVPASDRIVSVTDNQEPALRIREAAEKIENQLISGNDVGDLSTEEVAVALSEVRVLKSDFEGSYVRQSFVVDRAKKALGWIAEKAGEAVIGALALALLGLILAFFRVHI